MERRLAAAALLLLAFCPGADAAPVYQVGHSLYGCVDPRATLALRDPRERARGQDWARYVRRTGRCFPLTPDLRLDVILQQGGLLLLRRVPPRVGEPPIYVLAGEIHPAARLPINPVRPPAPPHMAAADAAPPTPAATAAPAPTVTPPASAPTQIAAVSPSTATPPAVAAPVPAVAAPSAPATPAPSAAAVVPAAVASDQGTAVPAQASPPAAAASAPVATAAPPVPASPPAPVPAAPVPAVPAPPIAAAPVANDSVPAWPPHVPAGQAAAGSYGPLLGLLLGLLLLAFVVGAAIVARRRKHFAHVEDAGWPPNEDGVVAASPATATIRPEPVLTPQEFRRLCAAELDRAGWTTQMGFTGGGVGPDIVGKRDGAMLLVRCRQSQNVISGEMVDEAAAMGARQEGAITALVSNAPFSRRAREEALRQHIHLLRDTELADFGSS